MKLIRYGAARHEKPGIIHNDRWLDVSEYFEDYNEAFFENDGLTKLESLGKLPRNIPVYSTKWNVKYLELICLFEINL